MEGDAGGEVSSGPLVQRQWHGSRNGTWMSLSGATPYGVYCVDGKEWTWFPGWMYACYGLGLTVADTRACTPWTPWMDPSRHSGNMFFLGNSGVGAYALDLKRKIREAVAFVYPIWRGYGLPDRRLDPQKLFDECNSVPDGYRLPPSPPDVYPLAPFKPCSVIALPPF